VRPPRPVDSLLHIQTASVEAAPEHAPRSEAEAGASDAPRKRRRRRRKPTGEGGSAPAGEPSGEQEG
jgi:poly(A) polymerase